MKVGSLVYATDQGLGNLAKSFFDHGVLDEVVIIEHAHHKTHHEWYPGALSTPIRNIDTEMLMDFARTLDVLFCFETPFWWGIFDFCREHKIKTALMPMYECFPRSPQSQPDFYICPSELDRDIFSTRRGVGRHITYLPVPVDVKWRLRECAETFIHNAGHLGLRGRNGTKELLQALEFVKSPINLIIRAQEEVDFKIDDNRLSYRLGTVPFDELYEIGDVHVRPEKFNGLSLPLQESWAAGMMCLTTDRHPTNRWLPGAFIQPEGIRRAAVGPSYLEFDECIINPKDIAKEIDEWYGLDITGFSLAGQRYAERNSWSVLKPEYMKVLSEI